MTDKPLRCRLGLHKWEKIDDEQVFTSLIFPIFSDTPKGCVLCDYGVFIENLWCGSIKHVISWKEYKAEHVL